MRAIILVVENDSSVLDLISLALTDAGCSVIDARNGREALRKLAEHAARLDALITDIRLGSGPDGWAIGRAARCVLPFLPIIYMSGDGLHEWPLQGVAGSMFLPKPFRLPRLVDRIEGMFNRVTEGFSLPGLIWGSEAG